MRPAPNTVAAISTGRDVYRRIRRNSIPAANNARQSFRPCFLRHAGMSVNPAMAVESRTNKGSSFSETPAMDESPANESRNGAAMQCIKQKKATSIPRRSARDSRLPRIIFTHARHLKDYQGAQIIHYPKAELPPPRREARSEKTAVL